MSLTLPSIVASATTFSCLLQPRLYSNFDRSFNISQKMTFKRYFLYFLVFLCPQTIFFLFFEIFWLYLWFINMFFLWTFNVLVFPIFLKKIYWYPIQIWVICQFFTSILRHFKKTDMSRVFWISYGFETILDMLVMRRVGHKDTGRRLGISLFVFYFMFCTTHLWSWCFPIIIYIEDLSIIHLYNVSIV